MTVTDRLQTGNATITGNATFDDGPFTVHGVAQAAEVTLGMSGERRYWPPEVLRDAADHLEGVPIVDPDDHQDLGDKQPHPDIIIGQVVDVVYDDDRDALVYKGEIDDPDRARQIARGRVDVSPSVAFEPGEHDPDREAERVKEILGYRDLAIVADGAHASASIQPGTAEALARHFDGLQSPSEANEVDVDVSPPQRVVAAAEAAQQAQADDLIPESCGTGVGDTRMQQILDDELEPADFVTRSGGTPIPAYLSSHEDDTTTDDPPSEWGDELWEDCGNAQQAKWGWDVEWAQRVANDVMEALDEPPVYEGLQRQQARTPDYSGTQDADWSTPTLEEYLRGYDTLPAPGEVESVEGLERENRSLIARKSLLGSVSAETLRELRFFPVVDPATDELNRRALGAVRSGRGSQADIPYDALASAQRVAGRLLDEEFDADVDVEATAASGDVEEGALVQLPGDDGPVYGRVREVQSDEERLEEIAGDEAIEPPAVLVERYRPDGDGGVEPSGTTTGHPRESLTVVDELPEESPSSDDDPNETMGSSTPNEDDDSETVSDGLMDELTDAERELLAAARQLDDPTVVETEAAERLSDHDALLETATETDDPVVVSEPDYTTLEQRVSEVRDVLADALQAQTGLSEPTIEVMPFEALAAEFEADNGALDVESLAQSPETGSGPSSVELSDEDRERKQEIEERLSSLDGEDSALAEREMERLETELDSITEEAEG
jgi:hypothetical protein